MATQSIVKEVTIDAPAFVVWKALTDTAEMKNWYFNLENFEARPGFEFKFYAGPEGKKTLHICKVTEAEPNKKIAYTWQYENSSGNSVLSYELIEEGEQTKVKLTHEGFESFAADGPQYAKENFEFGWTHCIEGLKKYLETPRCLIENSVLIDAPVSRVWEVITTLPVSKKWTKAFNESAYIETTWEKGSRIEWKFGEGSTCAKGLIAESTPNKLIKADFYEFKFLEDGSMEFSDNIGYYSEVFEFSEQDGKTLLKTKVGPVKDAQFGFFNPMWEAAMPLIKEAAEKKN